MRLLDAAETPAVYVVAGSTAHARPIMNLFVVVILVV
jgi:hypothetical protein